MKIIKPETIQRIGNDPDYIAIGHHQNSLKVLKERYPDEAPEHIVARALARTERQIQGLYASTMRQLQRLLGVNKGE